MAKKAKQSKSSQAAIPKELIAVEKIVGQFMLYWGFKEIHGRIWTHLFLSSEPLDSLELMERLKVSKGLMSLALRDLLDYQVIASNHIGKHGTTYYVANPEVVSVISHVLKTREQQMMETALERIEKLKKYSASHPKISASRVDALLELTSTARFLLTAFLNNDQKESYSFLFSTPKND